MRLPGQVYFRANLRGIALELEIRPAALYRLWGPLSGHEEEEFREKGL